MWDVIKNRKDFLHETIELFGKRCRVFCNQCVESKIVTRCGEYYCRNQDVEQYCADHPEFEDKM